MMSLSTYQCCASAEFLHVGTPIYTMNLHLGQGQPESTVLNAMQEHMLLLEIHCVLCIV